MMQWRSSGKTQQIPIDELRYKLGIEPDQYKQMVNFKTKVLDLRLTKSMSIQTSKRAMSNTKKGGQLLALLSHSKKNQSQK